MQTVTTIGLDIAKSVFQVHGIDAEGNAVLRRQLKRRNVLAFFLKLPPCLVGIEACASSHHWSRELQALGHTVRLMPPAYVKPYVKRHKNDATDAEAICEAVTRANMRFVATKTPAQQSCLTLHRTRHLFIRQQTSVINAIRAHLAEFGIVAPIGRNGVEQLLSVAADANDKRLPEVARACVAALGAQLQTLKAQILEFDRMIMARHRSSEASQRLDYIPGVGPALATALVASIADPSVFRSGRDFSAWIGLVPRQNSSGGKDRLGTISKRYIPGVGPALATALVASIADPSVFRSGRDFSAWIGLVPRQNSSGGKDRLGTISKRYIPGVGPALATALVASIADPSAFRSGRDFSAWIGLVPRQNSSGGKDRLGNISKRGDRYLRSLFTTGALAVIRYAKIHGTRRRPWLTALLARRPTKVTAIALANKIARMAWAILAKGERYKEPAALAA